MMTHHYISFLLRAKVLFICAFVGVTIMTVTMTGTVSAITDDEALYLSERFSYYSTQLKNTSAHNHYSRNEYTTCPYYDVCNFDIDSIAWTVIINCFKLISHLFVVCCCITFTNFYYFSILCVLMEQPCVLAFLPYVYAEQIPVLSCCSGRELILCRTQTSWRSCGCK